MFKESELLFSFIPRESSMISIPRKFYFTCLFYFDREKYDQLLKEYNVLKEAKSFKNQKVDTIAINEDAWENLQRNSMEAKHVFC